MTAHVYKAIDGFPGYRVTDDGEVYSGSRPLRPRLVNGYHHVTLCRGGHKWQVAIHRLVAEAFVRPISDGEVVNHLNGNRVDNRASNLEVTTQSRNVQHSYELGLRQIDDAHRERAAALGRSKRILTDDVVRAIREGFTGKRGDVMRLARLHNTHHKTVRAILDGAAFGDVS